MAKRRAHWARLGAGMVGALSAARAAGGAAEADRLRALVANESRHLSLHDVQVGFYYAVAARRYLFFFRVE